MDMNFLRGLSTVLALGAFIAICLWAYSGRQKARFDEAANLPFADDTNAQHTDTSTSGDKQ